MRITTLLSCVALLVGCEPSPDGTAKHVPGASRPVVEAPPSAAAPTTTTSEQARPTRAPTLDSDKRIETEVAAIAIGDVREQPARGTPSTTDDEGEVSLVPDNWDPSAFVRPIRRIRVRALRRTLAELTGTAGWRSQWGQDQWGALEPTLGVPDWLLRVTEDLRPSATFMKFLRDAAIDVCLPMVEAEMDPNQVAPAARVFLVHADPNDGPGDDQGTRDNLAYLLLRFHGLDTAADSAEVDRWVQMVSTVMADTGSIAQAWQATCVALVIHQRFYSY